jgi:FG-GAP repeat
VLTGSQGNVAFGEELLGGLDWDLDGSSDLFIGDIASSFSGRPNAGSSHVIYDAKRLKDLHGELADLANLAPPVRTTTLLGAAPGDISGDTAAQGDFSGDGNADLVVCSPHASPLRRHSAGTLHVLSGRPGGWPARVDLRSDADRRALGAVEIYGAQGTFGTDRGDTLCYSAAAGDLNGDGRTDLITNEMVGNGLSPEAVNAGNLLLIDGELLTRQTP